jgi:hypothetical protein
MSAPRASGWWGDGAGDQEQRNRSDQSLAQSWRTCEGHGSAGSVTDRNWR